MVHLNFKNDFYDIARYKIFASNGSETLLKAILNKNSFRSIFKAELEKWSLIEKNEIGFDEIDGSRDTFSWFQLDNGNGIIITWQEVEAEIDEINTVFATGIQFNYTTIHKEFVNDKVNEISKNIHKEDSSKIFFVVGLNDNQYSLFPEKIEHKNSNIELNYGKEFGKVNDNILKMLTDTNSGIIVLNGIQGTGKTAYIKYLIHHLAEHKNIIYIPRFLLQEMANRDFISFLREQRESIIILEDADEILLNGDDGLSAIVTTNILSLTNGLLNDQLKIQIVATFNSERKYIDKKLLKEGKIIEDWTFKLLTADQANLLAKDLGFDSAYEKEISLADVYEDFESVGKKNKKTKARKINKKRVGFKDDSD